MYGTCANLAAFVDEDELDGIVRTFGYGGDLRRYPCLVLILEPNPSSFAVYVFRHPGQAGGRLARTT